MSICRDCDAPVPENVHASPGCGRSVAPRRESVEMPLGVDRMVRSATAIVVVNSFATVVVLVLAMVTGEPDQVLRALLLLGAAVLVRSLTAAVRDYASDGSRAVVGVAAAAGAAFGAVDLLRGLAHADRLGRGLGEMGWVVGLLVLVTMAVELWFRLRLASDSLSEDLVEWCNR